jgi:hypothetical protein
MLSTVSSNGFVCGFDCCAHTEDSKEVSSSTALK